MSFFKNKLVIFVVVSVVVLGFIVFFLQQKKDTATDDSYMVQEGSNMTTGSFGFFDQEKEDLTKTTEGNSNFMDLFSAFKEECKYTPTLGEPEEPERVFTSIEDLKKIFSSPVFSENTNDENQTDDTDSVTQVEPKKLSDEEYFVLFYGEPYGDYVRRLQQAMLDEGFIEEDEATEVKTEQDTYPIFRKFVDFMVKSGHMDKSVGQDALIGIEELIKINKEERPLMEKGILELGIDEEISKKTNSGNFLEKIISFFVSSVHAVGEVTGPPECYRPSPPGNNCEGHIYPAGFNGWAYCCNCGWKQEGYYRRWVADCSKENCDQNDGCLNSVCPRSAAIWDSFYNMGTGICGCACPGG